MVEPEGVRSMEWHVRLGTWILRSSCLSLQFQTRISWTLAVMKRSLHPLGNLTSKIAS